MKDHRAGSLFFLQWVTRRRGDEGAAQQTHLQQTTAAMPQNSADPRGTQVQKLTTAVLHESRYEDTDGGSSDDEAS